MYDLIVNKSFGLHSLGLDHQGPNCLFALSWINILKLNDFADFVPSHQRYISPLWSDIVLLFNWRERVIAVVDKHSIMFRTSDSEVLCNFCHRPTLNRWFIGSCHCQCHWHGCIHTLVKIFFLQLQSSWSSPQTSSPPPPLLFDRINGCHSADQGNKLVCTVTFYHHSWHYHLFFGINVRISIFILTISWWQA